MAPIYTPTSMWVVCSQRWAQPQQPYCKLQQTGSQHFFESP
jgi:hypothetical protein